MEEIQHFVAVVVVVVLSSGHAFAIFLLNMVGQHMPSKMKTLQTSEPLIYALIVDSLTQHIFLYSICINAIS